MTSNRRALTRRDFDEVMRRAAELASAEPDTVDRAFSEDEVLRIAAEVGLPQHHVRRALAEVRSGRIVNGPDGWRGVRQLFDNGNVWASRVIHRPREELRKELDEFMVAGQLLQAVRRREDFLQYRPAVDWASRVARAASTDSRQHYVAASRMVDVRLEQVEAGATLVEINVDPGIIGDHRAGAIVGAGAVGVGGAVGIAFALAIVAPLGIAIGVGVVLGSLGSVGVATLSGRALARRLVEVRSEVEGILDGLESGRGLEPPPPAWRRWVRRHFHGVAREMFGPEDTDW